ncbi:hypothetical protein FGO68_gene16209 [Halteria grandinella]|uniref:Uncharacterized protein n=1 Tax=Halteria grandinella TaxID=5974 RepID=A0A8J8NBV4_HALGN|nr:hypothetical protein FGO68_gene16209 [Halteria grandinella]
MVIFPDSYYACSIWVNFSSNAVPEIVFPLTIIAGPIFPRDLSVSIELAFLPISNVFRSIFLCKFTMTCEKKLVVQSSLELDPLFSRHDNLCFFDREALLPVASEEMTTPVTISAQENSVTISLSIQHLAIIFS